MSDTPQQPPRRRRRLEVEEIGDVVYVNFVDKRILDEQNIEMIGDELFSLVDEFGKRKIVLDYGNVEYMSSTALGKMIRLHRKLQEVNGKLIMCRIAKDILEVFKGTKLDKILSHTETAEKAFSWFLEEEGVELNARCPVAGCPGKIRFPPDSVTAEGGQCPECRAIVRFAPAVSAPQGRVGRVTLTTYEQEYVALCSPPHVDVSNADDGELDVSDATSGAFSVTPGHSTLVVRGRLDLFAAEQLEKLWRTVPDPRRMFVDLRQGTEITPAGADVLARLTHGATAPPFLLPASGSIDAAQIPGPTFRSGKELRQSLGRPDEKFTPLLVPVTVSS